MGEAVGPWLPLAMLVPGSCRKLYAWGYWAAILIPVAWEEP